jgi:hypothetical protein
MNKITRQIDGHKFYSSAYKTKEEAKNNQQDGYTAIFEDGFWYNYGGAGGASWQEDIHVAT